MRQSKKEEKSPIENGFQLPPFRNLAAAEAPPLKSKPEPFTPKEYAGPYNQFAGSEGVEIKLEESKFKELIPEVFNGYDGSHGVHDNLVWLSQEGWQAYTLHNKVVFEKTKTREQQILVDSTVQLSTLALSPDHKFLAVGEG